MVLNGEKLLAAIVAAYWVDVREVEEAIFTCLFILWIEIDEWKWNELIKVTNRYRMMKSRHLKITIGRNRFHLIWNFMEIWLWPLISLNCPMEFYDFIFELIATQTIKKFSSATNDSNLWYCFMKQTQLLLISIKSHI